MKLDFWWDCGMAISNNPMLSSHFSSSEGAASLRDGSVAPRDTPLHSGPLLPSIQHLLPQWWRSQRLQPLGEVSGTAAGMFVTACWGFQLLLNSQKVEESQRLHSEKQQTCMNVAAGGKILKQLFSVWTSANLFTTLTFDSVTSVPPQSELFSLQPHVFVCFSVRFMGCSPSQNLLSFQKNIIFAEQITCLIKVKELNGWTECDF